MILLVLLAYCHLSNFCGSSSCCISGSCISIRVVVREL